MVKPTKTIMNGAVRIAVQAVMILAAFLAGFGQSAPATKTISGGVLNGRALSLPKPVYPSHVRGITGEIKVQILIDEAGKVVSATVVSGVDNASLRAAAVDAAGRATFSPTLLSGKPAKVSGVIVYNFVAEKKGYEEELKYIVLSVLIRITRESVSHLDKLNETFESKNIFEEAARDPDVSKLAVAPEIRRLVMLDKLPVERRTEVIDSVYSAIRSKLSGSDKWQFEVGESVGDACAPFLAQYLSGVTTLDLSKINESGLRAALKKLRDLTDSAPRDVPSAVLEKLKEFASLGKKEDLITQRNLKDLVDKMLALFETISPDDESDGN